MEITSGTVVVDVAVVVVVVAAFEKTLKIYENKFFVYTNRLDMSSKNNFKPKSIEYINDITLRSFRLL